MPVNEKLNNSNVNGNERGLGLSHTRRPSRLVQSANNTEITEELGDIRENISNTDADVPTNNTKVTKHESNVAITEQQITTVSNIKNVADNISTASSAPLTDISENSDRSPLEESLSSNQPKRNPEPPKSEENKPELAPPLIPDKDEKGVEEEVTVTIEEKSGSDDENMEILRQAKIAADVKNLENKITSVKEDDTLWIRVPSVPSNDKAYDSEDNVFYRRYTYGDYEDINNADIPLRDRYSLSLQGIRVDSLDSKLLLPFCDFSYINVLRRLEAQGTRKFSVPYTCNTCGQIGAHTFTLDEISFKTCDHDLPIKVRFRSYPDEIFEFNLVTIGDVLSLMDNDNYYRKEKNGDYKTTMNGNLVVDRLAVLCSACTSHKYKEAYQKLNQISNNQDYRTLTELRTLLNPGLSPMEFKCSLYLPKHDDPEKIEEENEEKLDALRDSKGELPAFMKLVRERKSNKICGAKNTVDIEGGDVLILPFREHTDDNEYGILS